MRRLIAWAGRNIDGVVTLVITVLIVTLDLFGNISEDLKSGAVLLVLGTLAVTMLRDRETVRRFASVPETVNALESTVASVGRAVDDMSMVRVLTWSEVSATYAEARRTTDRWVFRGGTGTYVRART